jgi:hypothetical protein
MAALAPKAAKPANSERRCSDEGSWLIIELPPFQSLRLQWLSAGVEDGFKSMSFLRAENG